MENNTNTQNNDQQNKMGTMPVGKLLVSMALPMMLSFLIQALYNIVDSMFVARLSEDALTAVTLAFPMQNILIACGVGIGVGINAMIPRAIALKDGERANRTANTGVFIVICFSVLFAILGFTAARPIMFAQTDITEIAESGTIYLCTCWILSFGIMFGNFYEKMLIAHGRAVQAMISQAIGAVVNIILDPILIFGLGPFPKLGVAGAAAATVAGQILAALTALIFNIRYTKEIKYSPKAIFSPSLSAAGDLFSVAIPSMVTIGVASLCAFSINRVLIAYSTTAIAVCGIWLKLQNFCFMPAFGFNNAMVPILSYNYARKNYPRIKQTFKYAISIIIGLMILLTVVFEFIPDQLLMLFDASENMLNIGRIAIRFGIASLVFGGANIVMGSAMQAMGHSRYSLILNVLRLFVLPFGFFWFLSKVFAKLDIMWAAIAIAEMLALLVAVIFTANMMRKIKKESV